MQRIREVMSKSVEVVSPHAKLSEVAQRMKSHDVGAIPICDGRRLQGMITDRDIVTRVLAENRDPNNTRALDVMSKEVLYCFEDQSVKEAAELMQQRKVRRLIVLDRSKNLVGIVSLGDIAAEAGREALAGETLSEIAEPGSLSAGVRHVRKVVGRNAGLLLFSSIVGGLYVLTQGRPEFREQFRKIIPFTRDKVKEVAQQAS